MNMCLPLALRTVRPGFIDMLPETGQQKTQRIGLAMIGIALTFVVLILAGVAPGWAAAQPRCVCVHV